MSFYDPSEHDPLFSNLPWIPYLSINESQDEIESPILVKFLITRPAPASSSTGEEGGGARGRSSCSVLATDTKSCWFDKLEERHLRRKVGQVDEFRDVEGGDDEKVSRVLEGLERLNRGAVGIGGAGGGGGKGKGKRDEVTVENVFDGIVLHLPLKLEAQPEQTGRKQTKSISTTIPFPLDKITDQQTCSEIVSGQIVIPLLGVAEAWSSLIPNDPSLLTKAVDASSRMHNLKPERTLIGFFERPKEASSLLRWCQGSTSSGRRGGDSTMCQITTTHSSPTSPKRSQQPSKPPHNERRPRSRSRSRSRSPPRRPKTTSLSPTRPPASSILASTKRRRSPEDARRGGVEEVDAGWEKASWETQVVDSTMSEGKGSGGVGEGMDVVMEEGGEGEGEIVEIVGDEGGDVNGKVGILDEEGSETEDEDEVRPKKTSPKKSAPVPIADDEDEEATEDEEDAEQKRLPPRAPSPIVPSTSRSRRPRERSESIELQPPPEPTRPRQRMKPSPPSPGDPSPVPKPTLAPPLSKSARKKEDEEKGTNGNGDGGGKAKEEELAKRRAALAKMKGDGKKKVKKGF